MKSFEYAEASNKEQAVRLLSGRSAPAILAGGTDLLSLMKDDGASPDCLVSIKKIDELRGIARLPEGGWRIGALTTIRDLQRHSELMDRFPSIAQAADGIRSPQIQNMGTVGGDLCQRPRCWYFRNGFGLLAMQDGESMVLKGDNRYHAILGNDGPAYFVSPSSLAPALQALGAQIEIYGPDGVRTSAVADFYRIPRSEEEREHRLEANELVTAVLLPPGNSSNATYEVRQREALDWPLATASVSLTLNGDRVEEASIVMGHVAPVPWAAEGAASGLKGKTLNSESARAAAEASVEGARPLSRNRYKVRLAKTAVRRALLLAGGLEE